MRAPALRWIPVLGLLPLGQVLGFELTADVSHRSEYTTNTARTETDKVSEWIHAPGISVTASQAGAQLEVDAAYQYEKRFHQEDLYDDENSATGNGSLVWHVVPERLDVSVRNVRTESSIRAIDANTPDNRQVTSYTEAGPTLRLQPRSGDELQLEYLYTDVSARRTNTDSERHTGSIRYIVGLSAVRSFAIEGRYTDVDYDEPLSPDLEISSGFATLSGTGDVLAYSVSGGYSNIKRTLGRDDVGGATYEATLDWQATPSTTLTLDAARSLQDYSTNLTAPATGIRQFEDENTDLNEPFVETRGALTLRRPLGHNDVYVTVSAVDEDYEDVLRDNRRIEGRLGLSRDLSRSVSLNSFLSYGNRDFKDEGEEYDEIRGSLRLSWRVARRLTLSAGIEYEEREPDGEAGGQKYDEWVSLMELRYGLLGAR